MINEIRVSLTLCIASGIMQNVSFLNITTQLAAFSILGIYPYYA